MSEHNDKNNLTPVSKQFVSKVLAASGVVISLLLLLFLFKTAFKVVMLVLAAVLVNLFFSGIASKLRSLVPMSRGLSLVVSVVLVLGFFTGFGFLIAPKVSEQYQQIQETLPDTYAQAKEDLAGTGAGEWIVNQLPDRDELQSSGIQQQVLQFFSSTFGVLADVYILFFLSAFIMASPGLYVEGIVRLFPLPKRTRAREIFDKLTFTLRRWLFGQLLSMLFVGVFTAIGLWILGIPLALTLALLAGILGFIPNFGPLLALIPALLIGWMQGPMDALYVVILYMGIQAVESNLFMPYIQKKMIQLPMALILIAQVLLGIIAGGIALILAVPIMAIVIVLIRELYVKDVLGDPDA